MRILALVLHYLGVAQELIPDLLGIIAHAQSSANVQVATTASQKATSQK